MTSSEKANAKGGVREPIVAAAAVLFREQGYAGTSMQDIAAAVGLSRPALYYHFKNKHDILAALVEEITLRTSREATRIAAATPGRGPVAILREIVRAQALWILQHPQQFAVLQREERHLPEPARALQRQGKRDLLDKFAAVIGEGVRAGLFRNIDAHVAALGIFGMCNWTVEWFQPGGRLREAQVADAIADFALAMVGRPSGEGRDPASPEGWLSILRDDISHLERVIAERGS